MTSSGSGADMSDSLRSVGAVIGIWVDDADAVCSELAAHGVPLLNGPMNREWGMRTASFTDPDGHVWEIAQEIPRSQSAAV